MSPSVRSRPGRALILTDYPGVANACDVPGAPARADPRGEVDGERRRTSRGLGKPWGRNPTLGECKQLDSVTARAVGGARIILTGFRPRPACAASE